MGGVIVARLKEKDEWKKIKIQKECAALKDTRDASECISAQMFNKWKGCCAK